MLRFPRKVVLAAAASVALAVPAFLSGQDDDVEPDARPITLKLTSGTRVRGTVVEAEGERVRLRMSAAGGTIERWYQTSDFDDTSQVRLKRAQVAENDVEAQLAVAELAADKGLLDMARVELTRCAYMADESGGPPRDDLKSRAIDLTVRLLDAYCERGDVAEARSAVSRIVTRRAERLTAEEERRLVESVEASAARFRDQRAAARRAKEDDKAAAKRTKELAGVYKKIDKANAQRRDGLLSSRRYTAASRDIRGAVKTLDGARKDVDKLKKKFVGDAVMLAELEAVSFQITNLWEDSLLSAASLDLARGNFNRAMESVNRILADHPNHALALNMRSRIEVAQTDWGWGWGWGRYR